MPSPLDIIGGYRLLDLWATSIQNWSATPAHWSRDPRSTLGLSVARPNGFLSARRSARAGLTSFVTTPRRSGVDCQPHVPKCSQGKRGLMAIFHSPELDMKFARDGFVVVRLIDEHVADALGRRCRDSLPADIPAHENVTYIYTDEPELAWIEDVAGPVFDEAMMPLLKAMRRLHPSIIVKPAGERAVPPHVHPIFTLDQSAPTVFCWCALEDMRDENGVMQVLPGSHKLFPIMPMYGQEPYFLRAWDEIAGRMEPVYLKAGEAMLFDESLIHASMPNSTGRHRLALATHCIPQALEPIALFPESNGQYRVYETGADFGYQYHIRPDLIDPSERWTTLGYVDDVHEQVDPDEFWRRLEAGEHITLTYPLVPRAQPAAPARPSMLRSAARAIAKRIRQHA
ncbi:phytanoyl-CoA dioxygenase family protein [Flavisphingopyxis soli]|nr:phytanoyl-CoA dioxygenase family protein [Sphingorhabdus soli]